ncbi:uncharacterized protein A4U43_C07F10760 [Asparagus officinalis]|uniref:Glabrous enhancer-binding protein-like DBD domain-containing protein n=1 Tax=Asparagus officinalis TaxID=4686 RepID=A0A5P1EDZ9_ASPOF|nr:uncharacterized protein A4U43_C07F10760 [Asparagus officinalis]
MAPEDEDPVAFNDEDDDLEDTDDTDMDDRRRCPPRAPGSARPRPPQATRSNSSRLQSRFQPDQLDPICLINPNLLVGATSSAIACAQNALLQVTRDRSSIHRRPALPATCSLADVKAAEFEERRPQPSTSLDESRRLFQRLWTDDDEIKILTRFLEFTSSRGTTFASHQYDTGPFYEQIKNELQLDFNKNQLIEKLRRLKKKYRNTATRMANHGPDFTFRSPHEKATYDIAKRIWSAGIKRSRESDDEDLNPYANNTSDAGANFLTGRPGDARGPRKGVAAKESL